MLKAIYFERGMMFFHDSHKTTYWILYCLSVLWFTFTKWQQFLSKIKTVSVVLLEIIFANSTFYYLRNTVFPKLRNFVQLISMLYRQMPPNIQLNWIKKKKRFHRTQQKHGLEKSAGFWFRDRRSRNPCSHSAGILSCLVIILSF